MDGYTRQQKKEEAARKLYEEKEELYRSAAIGLAARFLEEGKPCPVCGSLTHPDKAKVSKTVPDQEEVEDYKKKAEKERECLDTLFAETREALGALRQQEAELSEAGKRADIRDEKEGEEKYRQLKQEEEACEQLVLVWKKKEKDAKGVEKELKSLESQMEALKKRRRKTGQRKKRKARGSGNGCQRKK